MTPLQYSLLSILVDKGEADQTTLAQTIALDRTTTTGALRRLESRGLVSRSISSTDKRSQSCRATPEGLVLHRAMDGPVREAHDATLAALAPTERVILLRLIRKIVTPTAGDQDADG